MRTSLLGLVLALLLAACSGDGPAEPAPAPASADQSAGTSGAADGTGEAYADVPAGVTLTEPGTALDLGDPATVAFPIAGGEVGVLKVRVDTVTEATARDFRGWLSPQALDESRPYFVEMRLANAGETDLGGYDVPVHLLDDNGTLGPPWAFDGTFRACRSGPMPERFAPGRRTRMCLVYLAPMRAQIEAMAFVPDAEAEPITWTGKVRSSGKARGRR